MKNLKINPKTLVVIDMIGTFTKKESSSIIYLSDDHNQSMDFPRHCIQAVEESNKKKIMHIPYIIGIA